MHKLLKNEDKKKDSGARLRFNRHLYIVYEAMFDFLLPILNFPSV